MNKTALTSLITGLLRLKGKVITMQIVHRSMIPYKHVHCIEREVQEAVRAHKPCILIRVFPCYNNIGGRHHSLLSDNYCIWFPMCLCLLVKRRIVVEAGVQTAVTSQLPTSRPGGHCSCLTCARAVPLPTEHFYFFY